jgi:L-glyceraldehyde 3-phosphate reductase
MIRHRRLGRTNLEISEIVFGGGFVGGILIHQDDDTRRKAIRRALDAGINWIDTASIYGQGKSEQALGWLLGELETRPRVSTKVDLKPEDLDDIPGAIEHSLRGSLERLRMDSVDLLQLHNRIGMPGDDRARFVSVEQVLGANGVADGLDRVREMGLTRHVGLTGLGDAPALCEVLRSGRFETAQVYYNMLNPSAARPMPAAWSGQDFSGVVEACRDNDVGIFGIRIFASGVLASDERHGREVVVTENSDLEVEAARARATLAAIGEEHGERAQVALRYGLANKDFSGIIVGMAELEHLELAIAAAEAGPLPPDAIERLEPIYESGFSL